MYINKLLAIRIMFFNSRLSRDRYCNFANWHKNYCMRLDYKHVHMPTISATSYDMALTVATKTMDQYFCWELWVESRISQVVGVIDQQSERCGAAI